MHPKLIRADEPLSGDDVSIRGQIIVARSAIDDDLVAVINKAATMPPLAAKPLRKPENTPASQRSKADDSSW